MSHGYAIVHVGYHKTATTWFQARFYPLVKSHVYVEHRVTRDVFLYAHAFKFEPQLAQAQLGLNGKFPPILCEEELSGSVQTGGHMGALSKDIAERIKRVLPQARIVVFIRNQIDMIAAVYAQYVKRGGTHRPHRLFFPGRYRKGPWQRPYKKPLFCFDHFEYIGLTRHYKDLFGPSNVYVFAYETFRQQPTLFIRDFGKRLGLEFDADGLDFRPVNTSYRRRTLRLARASNRLSCGSVIDKTCWLPLDRHDLIQRGLERLNETRLAGPPLSAEDLLGRDLVDFIRERYAESNRELARETGLPLGALGYP